MICCESSIILGLVVTSLGERSGLCGQKRQIVDVGSVAWSDKGHQESFSGFAENHPAGRDET